MLASAAWGLPAPDDPSVGQVAELPEVVVYPEDRPMLYMLGYVREYSTLSTLTDTVFLFREKMVDFMLPGRKVKKDKGWRAPRLLASRSCYRFTDSRGLDSVSDSYGAHFSWSDWIELPAGVDIASLPPAAPAGRRSPVFSCVRNGDDVSLTADLLADSANRRWAESFSRQYLDRLDFDNATVSCRYEDVTGDLLSPSQLSAYTLHVKSEGRGYDLSRSFRGLGPVHVETRAELYFADKRYMTLKEARSLEKKPPLMAAADICAPSEAPAVSSSVNSLMARVDGIDRDRIRLAVVPDSRLAGIADLFKTRRNTWQQFWDMICPPTYNVNTSTYPGGR